MQMMHITDSGDSIDDRDDSAQVRTFNSIHSSEASNLFFQSRVSFNSLPTRLDWRSVFSI